MKFALLAALVSSTLCAQDPEAGYQRARELVAAVQQMRSWQVKQIEQNLGEARDKLIAALKARPDYQAARNELARVEVLRRDYDAAIRLIDEVLRADPKNLEAQLTRANALVGIGKPGVARLFLQDALAMYPEHPDILFNMGAANLADGRPAEAAEAFRKVWQLEPGKIRGLEGIMNAMFGSEQTDAALQLVQTEAAKAPERADIQRLLGRAALTLKRHDLAIQAFQAVLKKSDKPTGEMWGMLGDAYIGKGDLPAAIAALEKACAANPEDPQFAAALGIALETSGLRKEAVAAYRKALKFAPQNGAVLNNLAYLLADTGGDLKEALEFAQRARVLLPTNPEVIDTVAWIYLKGNMVDAAIDLFQTLVNGNPSNASFRYHLGLALVQKGEPQRALPELKRALEDGPLKEDVPKIRELIRKLTEAKP